MKKITAKSGQLSRKITKKSGESHQSPDVKRKPMKLRISPSLKKGNSSKKQVQRGSSQENTELLGLGINGVGAKTPSINEIFSPLVLR
jgi:hypothetical protein